MAKLDLGRYPSQAPAILTGADGEDVSNGRGEDLIGLWRSRRILDFGEGLLGRRRRTLLAGCDEVVDAAVEQEFEVEEGGEDFVCLMLIWMLIGCLSAFSRRTRSRAMCFSDEGRRS